MLTFIVVCLLLAGALIWALWADVSITPANVAKGATPQVANGIAGETITAGMAVYVGAAGRYYKALNDTAPHALAVGIALHGSLAGQPLQIQLSGQITIGGTVAVGSAYFVSGTGGGICPEADLTTGMFATFIGFAISTTVIQLAINPSSVAVP